MATRTNRMWIGMMVLLLGLGGASRAEELGTVFSYQGRLETAGSPPLNGSYDFKFKVFDNEIAGIEIDDLGEEPNIPVTEGIFNVTLKPNNTNLFNGEARYLEIAVRGKDDPNYFTISPRQRINPAPYAITASSARWLRGPSSTEKVVYVDDAGNVGIRTTSPGATLDVNGDLLANNTMVKVHDGACYGANSYTITGLDGNKHKIYKIYFHGYLASSTGDAFLYLRPNNDTGDNYRSWMRWDGDASGWTSPLNTGIYFGRSAWPYINGYSELSYEFTLFASRYYTPIRFGHGHGTMQLYQDYRMLMLQSWGRWDNPTNNITSVTITASMGKIYGRFIVYALDAR